VTPARYRREYFWRKTIHPIMAHLRASELIKLRPRHLRQMIQTVFRAWRAR
jgi:hypothetical protein